MDIVNDEYNNLGIVDTNANIILNLLNFKLFSSVLSANLARKLWNNELEEICKYTIESIKGSLDKLVPIDFLTEFVLNINDFIKSKRKINLNIKKARSKFNARYIEQIFDNQGSISLTMKEAYEKYKSMNPIHYGTLNSFTNFCKKTLKIRLKSVCLCNEKHNNIRNSFSKKLYILRLYKSLSNFEYKIFMDESHFSMKKIRTKRWSNKSANKKIKNKGRQAGVSITSAISYDGFIHTEFNYKSNQQENIIDFLKKMLEKIESSPYLFELYINNKINIHLDNARIHTGKKVISFLNETSFKVTFLPPYAPWSNGIEYIWAFLKNAFNKHVEMNS